MEKRASRWSLAVMAVLSACGAEPDQAPPLQVSLDQLMLADLVGALHLRVFPRGALRCDAASGQVRDAAGARVLAGLPGRDVTPAVRCGVGWATQSARYGTASPVDTCFTASQPTTVSINDPGAYIVLVHGQGDLRLPDGTTRSEILGSGCAEVTIAAGQQQSATVVVREQRPVGRCGDEVLDFDEACDLGAANMDGGACSSRCQTPVLRANTTTAGFQRRPAVVWPTGRRLVVAWQVGNVPAEDVKARYFAPDGTPEMIFGALRNEVVLGGGASTQSAPVLTPVTAGSLRGFAGAWETLQVTPGSVAAQVFNDDPPPGSGAVLTPGARRASPTVAASAERLLLAWREPGMGLRASTFSPVARPLGNAGTPVSIADGELSDPARGGLERRHLRARLVGQRGHLRAPPQRDGDAHGRRGAGQPQPRRRARPAHRRRAPRGGPRGGVARRRARRGGRGGHLRPVGAARRLAQRDGRRVGGQHHHRGKPGSPRGGHRSGRALDGALRVGGRGHRGHPWPPPPRR
nr:hypothetical protein [Deltaproteobacteria bacterium]